MKIFNTILYFAVFCVLTLFAVMTWHVVAPENLQWVSNKGQLACFFLGSLATTVGLFGIVYSAYGDK